MVLHKLTPRKVDTAKTGKHEDGGGLRLVVSKKGSKRWVLRITVQGKRREMGLGSYPTRSLKDARDLAGKYREIADQGKDPIAVRAKEAEGDAGMPTFTTCAARFIMGHRREWKNVKHRFQWTATLKTYARPVIGNKPVDKITTEDVLTILQPIWTSKTETAKRVQSRLENVLDYAIAHGYTEKANPARWRGHMDKLLPKPNKVKTVRHHPAMPYSDLPTFMQKLRENGSLSAMALQFLTLTATRTSEVLQATWSEVDLEATVWTIPAERMKMKREHRVPLSDAALMLLESLPRMDNNPYLFPGSRRGRPLSNMALLQLMRGMGYGRNQKKGPYVPHGFRSSFRDWSGEVSSYPRDVAEMALAHAIENKVEAAYRRGDLFLKRRHMMQDWSNFITQHAAELVQLTTLSGEVRNG